MARTPEEDTPRFDGPAKFVDRQGNPVDAVPAWTPEDEKAWRDAGKPTEP